MCVYIYIYIIASLGVQLNSLDYTWRHPWLWVVRFCLIWKNILSVWLLKIFGFGCAPVFGIGLWGLEFSNASTSGNWWWWCHYMEKGMGIVKRDGLWLRAKREGCEKKSLFRSEISFNWSCASHLTKNTMEDA